MYCEVFTFSLGAGRLDWHQFVSLSMFARDIYICVPNASISCLVIGTIEGARSFPAR